MKTTLLLGSLMVAIATGDAVALMAETPGSAASPVTHSSVETAPDGATTRLASRDQSGRADADDSTPASDAAAPLTSLELLNQGTEPRQVIRFAPEVGTEQRSQLTMTLDADFSLNGQPQPSITTPSTLIVIDTRIRDVDEDGDISADFTYADIDIIEDVTLPPGAAEALRTQLEQLIGTTGTIVFDPQGNAKDFTLDLPEGSSAIMNESLQQMTESLQQVSSPFPEEPIGPGARWRVPQTVTLNGVTFNQVVTYELVSQRDRLVELAFTIEQQGDAPMNNLFNLPGAIATVNQTLTSSGSGTTLIDTTQVMPISSRMTSTTQSSMLLSGGPVDAVLDLDLNLNLAISSEQPDADEPLLESEASVEVDADPEAPELEETDLDEPEANELETSTPEAESVEREDTSR